MMAKCLLKVAGPEAKAACGTTQLAGSMEAGIEGDIHAMRVLLDEHKKEEDWGFLLIDARNSFNEENWAAMLSAFRHEWTSGTQFTFNCYQHWATLVIRDTGDGSGHFLNIKEGVTKGDPLAMIEYGIGVLSLIRELRNAQPRVTQPWYADDAGGGGDVPAGTGALSVFAIAGTSLGLLLGSDQEHLGCGPGERRTC